MNLRIEKHSGGWAWKLVEGGAKGDGTILARGGGFESREAAERDAKNFQESMKVEGGEEVLRG